MSRLFHLAACALLVCATIAAFLAERVAATSQSGKITRDSQAALQHLFAVSANARGLVSKARAILVFPHIAKAGQLNGGQGGDGALLRGGQPVRFYRIAAESFGPKARAQS